MPAILYRIQQFWRFYWAAATKYQVHSPFVFELIQNVLEDDRWFYAFRDVERVRAKMLAGNAVLQCTDYGTASAGQKANEQAATHQPVNPSTSQPLKSIVRHAACSPAQGRRLFRLVNFLKPTHLLELGASVGMSTMYLAAAARPAPMCSLEGCPACANVARLNLEVLHLSQAEVITGHFEQTLGPALAGIPQLDFVFFDGNHRREPTLRYFGQCLAQAHVQSVFVFDDIYWSAEMTAAWRAIQAHERVTMTVDCYHLGLVFFNPDFREKQHFQIVPSRWKPWRIF